MDDSPKIVELEDDSSDENCSESEDENGFQIKFKQNVLKNRSMFERQLLNGETTDFVPEDFFEMKQRGASCGDREMEFKMDSDILELDDDLNEDDVDNRLLKYCQKMTPLEGYEGIFKKLCSPGEGRTPPENSIVTIHYNGYIQDEISGQIKSFDSSVLRGKQKSFMRGQGETILGLDLAVGSMKKKERSDFVFSPEFAYGPRGCPPRIPANAYVYFTVTLDDWVDSGAAEAFSKLPSKQRKELPFSKVLEAAKSEKRKGKAYFEKNNFVASARSFRYALGWIQGHGYADEEEERDGQSLCLNLNLNLAAVYLRLNRPRKTCIYCRDALDIDPNNPKAYYRLAKAQEQLGDFSIAQKNLLKAQAISPGDPSITRSLIDLNTKIEKEKFVEKELCARMLGACSTTETKNTVKLSNESAEILRHQLQEFAESTEKVLVFAPGKTLDERRFLEAEAKKLNLVFSFKALGNSENVCEIRKV